MKKVPFIIGLVLFTGIVGAYQIFPPSGGSSSTGCTTTGTGVQKGNGTGGCSAAVPGTDYVGGQAALTGAGNLPLIVTPGVLGLSGVTDNGTAVSVARNLIAATDNTYDLGAVGATRFRNAYLSGSMTLSANVGASGTIQGSKFLTSGNCSSAASPAACGTFSSGSVVVAVGATTVVVTNTVVTANSQVQLTFDSSLGTKLAVTCNTTPVQPTVSARTAATNFTITVLTTPVTNPVCLSYTIVN